MLAAQRQTSNSITEQNRSSACLRCFCIQFLHFVLMTNREKPEITVTTLTVDSRHRGSLRLARLSVPELGLEPL